MLDPFEIEQARIENQVERNPPVGRLGQRRRLVELAQDPGQPCDFFPAHLVGLVEHENIGELDLIDEELGDGAVVFDVDPQPAIEQVFSGAEVAKKTRAVDDGDHRVQPGQLAELGAKLVRQGEGGRDGKRLGDTG